MEHSILVNVSGEYPRSLISELIKNLNKKTQYGIIFRIGNVIDDENFDFSLGGLGAVASIVGVGLAVTQLILHIVRGASKEKGIDQPAIKNQIDDELKHVPQASNFRIYNEITTDTSSKIAIKTHLSSTINIESLEILTTADFDNFKTEILINSIKKGSF